MAGDLSQFKQKKLQQMSRVQKYEKCAWERGQKQENDDTRKGKKEGRREREKKREKRE